MKQNNFKPFSKFLTLFKSLNKIYLNILSNIRSITWYKFCSFTSKKEPIFTCFVNIIVNRLVSSFGNLYLNIKIFKLSKFNWCNLYCYITKLNKNIYKSILVLQLSSIAFSVCFVLPFEIINPTLLDNVDYEKIYWNHYKTHAVWAYNEKLNNFKTLIENLKLIHDFNNNNHLTDKILFLKDICENAKIVANNLDDLEVLSKTTPYGYQLLDTLSINYSNLAKCYVKGLELSNKNIDNIGLVASLFNEELIHKYSNNNYLFNSFNSNEWNTLQKNHLFSIEDPIERTFYWEKINKYISENCIKESFIGFIPLLINLKNKNKNINIKIKKIIFNFKDNIINNIVKLFNNLYLIIKINYIKIYSNQINYINKLNYYLFWFFIILYIFLFILNIILANFKFINISHLDFNSNMLPAIWNNSSELDKVRQWMVDNTSKLDSNSNNPTTSQEITTISRLQTTNLESLNSNSQTDSNNYNYYKNFLNGNYNNKFELEISKKINQLNTSNLNENQTLKYKNLIENINNEYNRIKIFNQELLNLRDEAILKNLPLKIHKDNIIRLPIQEQNEFYDIYNKVRDNIREIKYIKTNIIRWAQDLGLKFDYKDLNINIYNINNNDINNAILLSFLILNKKNIKNYKIKFNNINKIIFKFKDIFKLIITKFNIIKILILNKITLDNIKNLFNYSYLITIKILKYILILIVILIYYWLLSIDFYSYDLAEFKESFSEYFTLLNFNLFDLTIVINTIILIPIIIELKVLVLVWFEMTSYFIKDIFKDILNLNLLDILRCLVLILTITLTNGGLIFYSILFSSLFLFILESYIIQIIEIFINYHMYNNMLDIYELSLLFFIKQPFNRAAKSRFHIPSISKIFIIIFNILKLLIISTSLRIKLFINKIKNLNDSFKNIIIIYILFIILLLLIIIYTSTPSSDFNFINLLENINNIDNNLLKYVYLNSGFINIKYPSNNKKYPNNILIKVPVGLQFKLETIANLRSVSDPNNLQKYCVNTIREQIKFVDSWKQLLNNSNNRRNINWLKERPIDSDLVKLEQFLDDPFKYSLEDCYYWIEFLDYWNKKWHKELLFKQKNKSNKIKLDNKETNELLTNLDIRDALELPIWFSNERVFEIYNTINEWSNKIRKFISLIDISLLIQIIILSTIFYFSQSLLDNNILLNVNIPSILVLKKTFKKYIFYSEWVKEQRKIRNESFICKDLIDGRPLSDVIEKPKTYKLPPLNDSNKNKNINNQNEDIEEELTIPTPNSKLLPYPNQNFNRDEINKLALDNYDNTNKESWVNLLEKIFNKKIDNFKNIQDKIEDKTNSLNVPEILNNSNNNSNFNISLNIPKILNNNNSNSDISLKNSINPSIIEDESSNNYLNIPNILNNKSEISLSSLGSIIPTTIGKAKDLLNTNNICELNNFLNSPSLSLSLLIIVYKNKNILKFNLFSKTIKNFIFYGKKLIIFINKKRVYLIALLPFNIYNLKLSLLENFLNDLKIEEEFIKLIEKNENDLKLDVNSFSQKYIIDKIKTLNYNQIFNLTLDNTPFKLREFYNEIYNDLNNKLNSLYPEYENIFKNSLILESIRLFFLDEINQESETELNVKTNTYNHLNKTATTLDSTTAIANTEEDYLFHEKDLPSTPDLFKNQPNRPNGPINNYLYIKSRIINKFTSPNKSFCLPLLFTCFEKISLKNINKIKILIIIIIILANLLDISLLDISTLNSSNNIIIDMTIEEYEKWLNNFSNLLNEDCNNININDNIENNLNTNNSTTNIVDNISLSRNKPLPNLPI